jgi:hypothetical protein
VSQNEKISEIELTQARLRETIEESKRMIGRSQDVLNRHRHGPAKGDQAR